MSKISRRSFLAVSAAASGSSMFRLARAAGVIPGFLAFFLNETPQAFMESRLETFLPALKQFGYYVPVALTGVLFSISGVLYMLAKPKMRNNILPFPK